MKTIAFYSVFAVLVLSLCCESVITFGVALLMAFFLYMMVRGKSEKEIKELMGQGFLKKLGEKSKFFEALTKEEEETVC